MSDSLLSLQFRPVARQGTPEVIPIRDCLIENNSKMVVVASPWPESAWFGVSREDIDGEGWKSKGVFFGGPKNLSDGGGLLVSQWLDSQMDFHPDAIKMTVDRSTDRDRVGVYYDYMIDEEWYSLGQAFDVSYNFLNDDADKSTPWYPVIRYNEATHKAYSDKINEITITCEKGDRSEPSAVRVLPPIFGDITGTWKLSKLFVGPELGEFPVDDAVADEVKFSLNGATERFNMKVGNSINGAILGLSSCQTNMQEGFCRVEVQLGGMTMMMVGGPKGELEQKLVSLLPHVTKLHVDEDAIIMNGPDVEVILSKDDSEVVTYNDVDK